MKPEALDTHQKARQINQDPALCGTFIEAGGGQNVASWFTNTTGRACVSASAIGLRDPELADDIYGLSESPASRQRLEVMVEREFDTLVRRLDSRRGAAVAFFASASVLETPDGSRPDQTHAWIAIRFQDRPRALPSQVIVHVRLRDPDPARNQEVLGVLGVNLVYGAWHLRHSPESFVLSLLDQLVAARLEIDLVEFSGLAFPAVNPDQVSRMLIEHGLTDTPMPVAKADAACVVRHRQRRLGRPMRVGLMDSVHLAGMPKAA